MASSSELLQPEPIQSWTEYPSANDACVSALLPRRKVIYCGACGMPYEYCEYGPDYETHCLPWLSKHHPRIYNYSTKNRASHNCQKKPPTAAAEETTTTTTKPPKPTAPWTMQERLLEFYQTYDATKIDSIATILEKYAGKEDKLFLALVTKYGPEPMDPYYSDDDDDDSDDNEDDNDDDEDDDDDNDNENTDSQQKKKLRRGVAAKKVGTVVPIKIIIVKQQQKKKRCLTVLHGMDTIPNIKLKDITKTLSKRFAGSSSIKDNNTIIVQGDHTIDIACFICDKLQVPDTCIYLDLDNNGQQVPFK